MKTVKLCFRTIDNRKIRLLLVVVLCLTTSAVQATRFMQGLNTGWKFHKGGKFPPPSTSVRGAVWQEITLPHTWNKTDVMDDAPGYYRGPGWYKKSLRIAPSWRNKTVALRFDGVNQQCEVFVNGIKAGEHAGGYTRFYINIDPFLKFGPNSTNILLVKVDNTENENIPPLSADFTFFGGIYRSVSLIVAGKTHFSADSAGSILRLRTPYVSAATASVGPAVSVAGLKNARHRLLLQTIVRDRQGKNITESTMSLSTVKDSAFIDGNELKILNPHLWSPLDPYLYSVSLKIIDSETHTLLDEQSGRVGFRWFKFDADSGFFLNGRPCKLIGASRHQDFEGKGNALTPAYAFRDVKLLKEMGGNFLRVAHYPQDQSVLDACDELGILASVEIPVVNAINETEAFSHICLAMQTEMIRQNISHPSIILWGYMNEVLLRPKFAQDKERQQVYYAHIKELATKLEDLTRREDPYRYTFMANHGDLARYEQAGLLTIPMVIGWNLYQGWYSDSTAGFASFLDRFHRAFPAKPLLVTEFGADADPRIHSLTPERFDKSVEYSLDYHKTYIAAIRQRPFVAGAMVWNLADFNSESREETMPHINNKGLLRWDRQKKDLYYLYQGLLTGKPFIQISGWTMRSGLADSVNNTTSLQQVSVFSNLTSVILSVNGKALGAKEVVNGSAVFDVPFQGGLNRLVTSGLKDNKIFRDQASVRFELVPFDLSSAGPRFKGFNVLLGAKRIFVDERSEIVWIPAKPYKKGSWGVTGGVPFRLPAGSRQSYGTDRNIRDTERDPVYQTQQTGIESFRFDVPDGVYRIMLHFAELNSGQTVASLAYNLDDSSRNDRAEERVFDIRLNTVFNRNFNIMSVYGPLTAGEKSFTVTARNGSGVAVSFHASKGAAVLNAIQIRKSNSL